MMQQQIDKKQNLLVPGLSLLTSLGTLVCCALPALFVTLGAGAALAGLVSSFPQLVWLSAHKVAVFSIAGVMLVLAGAVQWKNRHAPCPADPAPLDMGGGTGGLCHGLLFRVYCPAHFVEDGMPMAPHSL